jgi:beta-lactamase class A
MTNKANSPFNHAYYYSNGQNVPVPPVPKKPKKRRGKFLKRFIFLIVIVVVALGAYSVLSNSKNISSSDNNKAVVISPNKGSKTTTTKDGISRATIDTMAQTINGVIVQNSGIDMSVNVIDLSNNQAFHYGTNESTFQDASTAKIITAEYFLHEVEEGQQSLTETVNGHTAEYELQQMIVVSDDTAWGALNSLLGYNNLQNYADKQFGISDYQAYNNSSSSKDIALALQQLWQGTVLNKTNTQLLLGYLKIANYREYIVPAIPADDTIYHKIGLYQDYVNDAAIVSHNNQAYVIVIFTNGKGTYDWPARAVDMQNITKATLKAFFDQ